MIRGAEGMFWSRVLRWLLNLGLAGSMRDRVVYFRDEATRRGDGEMEKVETVEKVEKVARRDRWIE